jgi:hypothetical protein
MLYPLMIIDSVNIENAKEFLYRPALGITLMIIIFGKTLIDLKYHHVSSKKTYLLNTIFLTIYSIALADGIIFMRTRIIILYMNSRERGFIF